MDLQLCPQRKNFALKRAAVLRENLNELGLKDPSITDKQLLLAEETIQSAVRSLRNCRSCQKEDPSVFQCCRIHLSYELGEFREQVGPCPRKEEVRQKLALAAQAKKQMEEFYLSPRFRSRSFENFQPLGSAVKAYQAVRQWTEEWDEHKDGFLLHGRAGNGKTHLAVAAMTEVHQKYQVAAVFDVLPAFLAKLRQNFRESREPDKKEDKDSSLVGNNQLFDLYARIPLLVLDDIDKVNRSAYGSATPWTKETFFLLVNYRYENMLPTIFTMNENPTVIQKIFGEATYSRIQEMCQLIHNEGMDARRILRTSINP